MFLVLYELSRIFREAKITQAANSLPSTPADADGRRPHRKAINRKAIKILIWGWLRR